MKANKTQPSASSVEQYIGGISDVRRRADARAMLEVMRQATDCEPAMWGSSIVGFGRHHYLYESGREGDTVAVGFAARKQALSVYGLRTGTTDPLLEQLDLTSDAKGCIYVASMDGVDRAALQRVVATAFAARNMGVPGGPE